MLMIFVFTQILKFSFHINFLGSEFILQLRKLPVNYACNILLVSVSPTKTFILHCKIVLLYMGLFLSCKHWKITSFKDRINAIER